MHSQWVHLWDWKKWQPSICCRNVFHVKSKEGAHGHYQRQPWWSCVTVSAVFRQTCSIPQRCLRSFREEEVWLVVSESKPEQAENHLHLPSLWGWFRIMLMLFWTDKQHKLMCVDLCRGLCTWDSSSAKMYNSGYTAVTVFSSRAVLLHTSSVYNYAFINITIWPQFSSIYIC